MAFLKDNFAIAVDQWKPLKEKYGNDLYFSCNGRLVDDSHIFSENCLIKANLRVLGGKGGFGSMLRALGARIEKTTNHEACRDLNGRRMRDVNNEKNIADWLKNQDDKEEERQKKRLEKLEKVLNPTHHYQDQGYTSSLQQNVEKVNDALNYALLNGKSETEGKRKSDTKYFEDAKIKKPKVWIGLDGESDQDLSDDENAVGNLNSNSNELENNCETKISNNDSTENGQVSNGKDEITSIEKTSSDNTCRIEKNEDASIELTKSDSTTQNENSNNTKIPCASLVNDIAEEEASRKSKSSSPNENISPTEPQTLDLSLYNSAEHLEEVGLDILKVSLMYHGLKCGGTLQERAKRLFLLKDTPIEKLDPNMFAKATKKKKKK